MAGYSGTPLAKKLGIKDKFKAFAVAAPNNYRALLEPLPEHVLITSTVDSTTNLVHLFTAKRAALSKELAGFRAKLSLSATVWVSWPRKSGKVPIEVTENTVREIVLPMGFVDLKVCAIDEIWSALKLVVRKELR
jgi:hypothetical protein